MSRKIVLFSSIGLFIFVFIILSFMEDTVDINRKEDDFYVPSVNVVAVNIGKNASVIKTFAEVKPRWSTTIRAQVSGEITNVFPEAMAGEKVNKGDVLIQIEESAYKARLARAHQALAEADFAFLQEKSKADVKLRDWKRSGLALKPSDMALNKPQLRIATKSVETAKANIKAAEKENNYTKVAAPFSGVITERFASVGQTVNVGESLLSILNQENLDITVSLSRAQWENLANDWMVLKAGIKNDDGQLVARANIRRGGGFLDPETRQHKLFLEIVNDEKSSVLAGDFVTVEIPGKLVENSLVIPVSSYTREATVWYVDYQSRLRYFSSGVLFYNDESLVVTAPQDIKVNNVNVVVSPLASFISGLEVNPIMLGVQ